MARRTSRVLMSIWWGKVAVTVLAVTVLAALLRADPPVLAVCNFTPVRREGYRIGVPQPGAYEVVLDTDEPAFGGNGGGPTSPIQSDAVPWQGREHSIVLNLPGLTTLWLKPAEG